MFYGRQEQARLPVNRQRPQLRRLGRRVRKKPYTERGIGRVPCLRCGKPSTQQWRICALDKWAGVCTECDVALNKSVLVFMGFPSGEVKEIIGKYREAKICQTKPDCKTQMY